MIGNNMFSPDSAGLTIWIDPLLIKNFDGQVDESPPCIGRFKNSHRNHILFIILQGFGSVVFGFLCGHERLAGSSFDSSIVCSIVLHQSCQC